MERRTFLRSVAAAVAAGVVFDVDRALWVPGAKKIFLPETILIPDCVLCVRNLKHMGAKNLLRVQLSTYGNTSEHLLGRGEVHAIVLDERWRQQLRLDRNATLRLPEFESQRVRDFLAGGKRA